MSPPDITIHPINLADTPEPARGSSHLRPGTATFSGALLDPAGHQAVADPNLPTPTTRRGRGRRLTPWLGLGALLLPFLARAQWPEPYPQVPLTPLVCTDTRAPLVLDVVDDRSSSTYDNDPRHRREPELRQVIEWLARANCHADDAVSVQHFDDVLPPVGRTALNDTLDVVLDALPDRAPESSSTLSPTTGRAASWASRQPEARNLLLIATDGELNDFEEAFAALEQYPGSIHVLALGGDLPPEWEHAPSHHVVTLRREARFGDIARAITEEIRGASHDRDQHGTSDG